ncbi:discoidin domain-containing protein [Myceligenerans pegani]|uniref:Discoidin domain-containing protein n=1 Tax=Myceligenerans pegani TaxID=2776917 RepID=A0ABR9MZC2_9MICO|nr:discoidin domain-containing protein [Myceligenerans sp. TRM 65318]MBE1876748.1 discoidin domain-containing protein [Myceligenerans sp. TRM 65318]MBE3019019.1 discoidin domain-containing protein [Myceligenerans sp. TRM 65318]
MTIPRAGTRAGTRTGRHRIRAGRLAAVTTALVAAAFLTPAGPAQAAPELLSQGMPATASSEENPDYTPAAAAVDGDPGTRWSSEFSDPQWLRVDLGSVVTLDRVELDWEAAYSTSYSIQVSDDGTTWRTLTSTDAGDGGNDVIALQGSGRYVRMHSTARSGGYGVSLWEMRVFGVADPGDPGDPGDPDVVDPGHPNVPVPGTGPSHVEVTGGNGSWDLTVDGQPYTVRGFTWGPSFHTADHYLPMLTATNANTVRTWGTGADTRTLLDSAAAHDVRVVMGFWLLPGGGPGSGGCIDYRTDDAYKSEARADILHWVDVYKEHPAVLMWNIGNESILGLQDCFSGTDLEEVRHAYAAFVNDVSVAVHAADPHHPTTSTDAWTGAWPYIERSAPDLDLLSVNSYGDVCNIRAAWESGGHDRPYLLTEGGAAGEWEVPDDAHGVPAEPSDLEKAAAYVNSWRCLREHDGVALGATFFHFGIEGDFGGVWFNVIPGDNKRLGYYSIARTWGVDTSVLNTPPEITAMDVPDAASVEAGGEFTVSVDMTDPDGDDITPVVMLNSKYVNGAGGIAAAEFTETAPGTYRVTAPDTLGVWKVYVFAEDGRGNVGVETRSFRVVAPHVDGENIALGAEASASSFDPYNGNFTPGQAVDGDTTTRWASEWGPSAWFQVDLGSVRSFQHLQLVWETAYGKAYDVQVSDDSASWTTIRSVTGGDGGVDDLDVSGTGRYVRLNLTERGTEWGYSLYELGVYQN